MSELDKLPSSWRDLLEVAHDIFSKSAPNPHDGRRYERPADASIDFDFDPDPGVWARIDPRADKFCVRVSLGAYLRLHGLALLLCKTKNRVKLINADRCIETSTLSHHAARLFKSDPKTLPALVDVILDVFNAVSFEEPIEQFSPFGSESETMTFYGLYFVVFHEFGHYWAGHFSLQNDSEARLRAGTAVRDNGTGSLWRVLEVQADMAGGDSVADLVLAAPELHDYVSEGQNVGTKNFVYFHSQVAGLAMFCALDLLDTMNPHFADRTDTHEHLDVRWQMASMAYVMHTKGLFGADFGFWVYEALVSASASYVGMILSPISDRDRRATRLDPKELGIRMYELFRNLGAVSEVLWHYIPGGATKGMREASTSRPDNLSFLGEAPDTAFFRTLRGENFEEEKAVLEKLIDLRNNEAHRGRKTY